MKTVKTTLSAELQDYLAVAPGETDSAKLHWVVNFWASTVDAHRERVKQEQTAKAGPKLVEAIADAEDLRSGGSEVAAASAIKHVADAFRGGLG